MTPIPQLIAEVLAGPLRTAASVPPEATLFDLGADSLHRQEIAMALEDSRRIQIPDAMLEAWQTVADVERDVARLTSERRWRE